MISNFFCACRGVRKGGTLWDSGCVRERELYAKCRPYTLDFLILPSESNVGDRTGVGPHHPTKRTRTGARDGTSRSSQISVIGAMAGDRPSGRRRDVPQTDSCNAANNDTGLLCVAPSPRQLGASNVVDTARPLGGLEIDCATRTPKNASLLAHATDVEGSDRSVQTFEQKLSSRLDSSQRLNCSMHFAIDENLTIHGFGA